MTEEKGFDEKKRTTNMRCMWVLLFYAGAATAAIITVSVLGVKYINDMERVFNLTAYHDGESAFPNDYEHYHLEHDHTECELDLKADKQLIRYNGPEYGENTIMVIDFKKGVLGIHDGMNNVCYLIGGLDLKLFNTTELNQILSKEKETDEVEDNAIYYSPIYQRLVKNQAYIPAEIQEFCWGKPVYWLQKAEETMGNREKRGISRASFAQGPIIIIIIT